VMPRLIAQGQRLAGWLSQVSPETEASRLLEGYVGPSEFRREYGGPEDERDQTALEEFRRTGGRHVAADLAFPQLEAWVEGGFGRQCADAERGRIRSRLAAEGTSSQDFEQWFRAEKVPELQAQAHKDVPAKGRPPAAVDPLVRAAAAAGPEE